MLGFHPPTRLTRGASPILAILALTAAVGLLPATVLSQRSDEAAGPWETLANHIGPDFSSGESDNLSSGENGLQLRDDPDFQPRFDETHHIFGLYTSPVISSEYAFDALRVSFEAETPPDTAVSVEVRVRSESGKWSPWQEVEDSGQAFAYPTGAAAAQYRATLLAADPSVSPSLQQVDLEIERAQARLSEVQFEAMDTHPTVRLYATRQGMVGRVTSNGHRITERDRFVALPSKKALNAADARDYQVEISYNGKKATAPVWDVGPWNIKDNFWDADREMWSDLPRFTPEVNAAFFDNYNGGLDQFGRPVLYPAAIDLADGTFWDDLGMTGSDWVDVTFLWIDAAAPPLASMPKVVAKAGPIPKPIFAQSAQPTSAPTSAPTAVPKTWYFAEGSTNKPFDTWLLLQNPDPEPANAKVTYMLPNGGQKIGNYLLKPTSRTSIYVNQEVPNTEVSTMIESDRYILAERAMYFGRDGHDTTGAVSPSKTWYFAEGSTAPPFDTWILMQNPNTTPATVNLTFFREDGSKITHQMLIPHVSRASLLLNQVVDNSSVGTMIESDKPIVAERAIYKEKGKAGSDSIGATALSKTWYMAEGVTRGGFDTWILMLNPNDVPAIVTATYMVEGGKPVSRQYLVPDRSRVSVNVNPEVPDARVGTMLQSDVPIVAERSVYFPGNTGSHNSMAAPAPSKRWYLPEGSTSDPFTQNTLLLNPNNSEAQVTAVFMKEDGGAAEKKLTMPPTSRMTLEMNSILPDTAFSTRVDSDQPIVVERSMYFADWQGGTNSLGIPTDSKGIPR